MTRRGLRLCIPALLFGLVAAGSGCATLAPSEAVVPPGAVPILATTEYQEWARKTQTCSGLTRDLSTVQFYVVPGVETFPTEEGLKVGMWARHGGVDRIVIAGDYLNHEMVVRHEMLHALLQREGHPGDYFVDRCHLTWESWDSGD